jgi:hypothetical protein
MYSGNMSFDNWSDDATNVVKHLESVLSEARRKYDKWYDFSYGKGDATLAAMLAVTEADVVKLKDCHAAFKSIYDLANGNINLETAYDFVNNMSAFQ